MCVLLPISCISFCFADARLQLDHILSQYGTLIVERGGSDLSRATDNLARWRDNIHLISQLIQNDVSSTKVRCYPASI